LKNNESMVGKMQYMYLFVDLLVLLNPFSSLPPSFALFCHLDLGAAEEESGCFSTIRKRMRLWERGTRKSLRGRGKSP
jgi:hypothetical protein